MTLRNPGVPDLIHRGEIAHVGKPDDGLQDTCLVRSGLGEQAVDRIEAILRLLGNRHIGAPDLTGKIDRVAVNDDL